MPSHASSRRVLPHARHSAELSGRDVQSSDSPTSQFVAVVSDSFAKYYWPNQSPMGRTFNFGNHDRVVIGVVGDVRVRGLERESEPQVYLPYPQHHDQVASFYAPKDLAIRASGNLMNLVPSLRQIVHEADPAQPISDVRTLADIVDAETMPRRVQAIALGSFAGDCVPAGGDRDPRAAFVWSHVTHAPKSRCGLRWGHRRAT